MMRNIEKVAVLEQFFLKKYLFRMECNTKKPVRCRRPAFRAVGETA